MTKVPFRVGTTSFIHRDGWAANAERLAGRVQDVELLLLEPGPGNSPDPGELERLALLRRRGLSYTVHAPLPSVASVDERTRRAAVAAACQAICHTMALTPLAWVLHAEGAPERARRSLAEILERTAIEPRRLCLEDLGPSRQDLSLLEALALDLDLSLALDLGHWHRDGGDVRVPLRRHLARARVIHWHGTDADGRDHRSLRHLSPAVVRQVVGSLVDAGWPGVLTLEVFSEQDLEGSLQVLHEATA